MHEFNLTTPIAFIIFNRPDTTKKVFERIRQAKPKQLFIIADGPRQNKPGEDIKCFETRALTNNIDWDCEVLRNYSEINLGCRKRVSSGIDWLFENVEEAIILEDDCLPHPSFFKFCKTMLTLYKNNEKVMMISGDCLIDKLKLPNTSYYFSNYTHIWGWATWKRAWQHYDVNMKQWSSISKNNFLKNFSTSKTAITYWKFLFDETFEGTINTWDYQWFFCIKLNNGITIIPTVNLVSNIGFGIDSTHTKDFRDIGNQVPLEEIKFPLKHPENVEINNSVDRYEEKIYHHLNFKSKIKFILKSMGLKFLFIRNK